MYSDTCSCCELPDLADNGQDWDDIYTAIANQLLSGEDLDTEAVYARTAKQLIAALNKGFGGNTFDDEDSRKALRSKFVQNIEQFSYAKTLTQFKLFKDAMFNDKGQIQSFATVKKMVADTGEVFNNNYLRAEHQFVTQTAIMANKWETLDAEYLEFSTVGDSHVRLSHKLFDKFTAPKSDPIWKRLYTPLDWGCRCTIIPGVVKNVSKEYDSKWANKAVDPLIKGTIFDNNAALTGKIFTEKHPYFNAKEKDNITKVSNKPFPLTDKNIDILKGEGFKFDTANNEGLNIFNSKFSKFNIQELNSQMDKLAKSNELSFNHKKINVYSNGIDIHFFDTKNKVTVSRKFYLENDKKIVKHDYFELPDHLQGKGFSKKMFQIWHKQYLAADIDKIKVHANLDIGGYTWAKYGFSPYDKGDLISIKINARKAYNDEKMTRNDFEEFTKMTKAREDGLFDLNLIAYKSYGKEILLGSSWKGELDLKNKLSKNTYEKYLFGSK